MEIFTKKLRLIYTKLFKSNIDSFTKAFINKNKFNIEKFDTEDENKAYEQFFHNRKIVLRRWLQRGISCTRDFKKSFAYYKISKYKYRGEPLFTLDDFQRDDNLLEFERRLDAYIKEQERIQTPIDYRYIYLYSEDLNSYLYYKIIEWKKGNGFEMIIELTSSIDDEVTQGRVSLESENNIFITLNIDGIKHYFLFHDNNDNLSKYTVGVSMGFSPNDNKVPIAKKVILSKEILDMSILDFEFILNRTEILSAIENRVTKSIDNPIINPLAKYIERLKNYYIFFSNLIYRRFKKNFYYRLALKEFNSFRKLFQRVVYKESYFTHNYHRAFYEMLETLKDIKNIPLFIVQEFSPSHFLVKVGYQERKIQESFFDLTKYGIEINLIVVIDKDLSEEVKTVMDSMVERKINIRVVKKSDIIEEVNSIDFAFIDTKTENDFVLADPLRDSKDVYKIFINSITMEEYHSDYYKIYTKSTPYKKSLNDR